MAGFPEENAVASRQSSLQREGILAALVFAAIFLTVIGFGATIIIRDLGKRETAKVLQGYSEELRALMARIPTTEVQKGFKEQTIVTTRLNEFAAEKKFFESVELYDEKGTLVFRDDRLKGGQILGGDVDVLGLKPGQQRVETKNRIPIEVSVPMEPGKMGRAVLSVSESLLIKQADEFRRELITKFVLLVALILLMVGLAFIYVLRVLKLSRRMEQEAQSQLRLSYLGLLSSGIAHEIKNPINSIQMNLQMLEEEVVSGASQEDVRSWLDPIRKEIRRLERLVNDFLLYARPLSPTIQTTSLQRVLEELRRLVSEEAKASGVALRVDVAEDLPSIETDEGLLRTALLNLVLNAIQASPAGGEVRVSAVLDGSGETSVEVRDNGPGVPEDQRERVFDIFFTTRQGGTGLGLPIARRLAETLGGSLSIVGPSSEGACFRLVLPAEAPPHG